MWVSGGFFEIIMESFLLLLLCICATQASSIVSSKYQKLKSGQNITGKLLLILKAKKNMHCSVT